MFDDKFGSQCQLVCLVAGVGAGGIALFAALGKVGFIAALMLGIAMAVFMALVLQQLFCMGSNADLGRMEETPASPAAATSGGAGSAATTVAGPPKANPPKDRGTPVPNAPVPNPPKASPPVGSAPSPRLPNAADPLNARTGTGSAAARAASDAATTKTTDAGARTETASGGNAAATAADPTFTSAETDAEAGAKVAPTKKDAPKPKAKPKAAAKPKTKTTTKAKETPADTADEDVGTKPAMLDAPRGDGADNLKEIKGVGPKLEELLHSMGVYHFDQIAGWSADEVAWVDANLKGFKGRVSRDNWIDQASTLASGGETEFSKRVDKGDVY